MDLIKEAGKFGIEITLGMYEKLEKYAQMLISYNKVMNLTAITEPDEIREKHFLDSLTLVTSGKLFEGCSLISFTSRKNSEGGY